MGMYLISAGDRAKTALGSKNAEIISRLLTLAAGATCPTSACLSSVASDTGYTEEEMQSALKDCHQAMMDCFQLPLLKIVDTPDPSRIYFSEAVLGFSRMHNFFTLYEWPCDVPEPSDREWA